MLDAGCARQLGVHAHRSRESLNSNVMQSSRQQWRDDWEQGLRQPVLKSVPNFWCGKKARSKYRCTRDPCADDSLLCFAFYLDISIAAVRVGADRGEQGNVAATIACRAPSKSAGVLDIHSAEFFIADFSRLSNSDGAERDVGGVSCRCVLQIGEIDNLDAQLLMSRRSTKTVECAPRQRNDSGALNRLEKLAH